MNINNRVLQSLINALSCLMNVLIDMTFTVFLLSFVIILIILTLEKEHLNNTDCCFK